jgi:hypothetical protein
MQLLLFLTFFNNDLNFTLNIYVDYRQGTDRATSYTQMPNNKVDSFVTIETHLWNKLPIKNNVVNQLTKGLKNDAQIYDIIIIYKHKLKYILFFLF